MRWAELRSRPDESDSMALIGVMKLVGGVLSPLGSSRNTPGREDSGSANGPALRKCQGAGRPRYRAIRASVAFIIQASPTDTDQAIARRVLREPHWGASGFDSN